MFHFKWLRRLVRRHTKPIPVDRAASVKQKLSFVYMLLAWNAFGVVCYMVYTGRGDWAQHYGYKSGADALIPPAERWARTLKVDKAKIVQISGFHQEGAYDYQNEGRKETSKPEEKNH